jgi:exopolyphosphatase/guanosine-5'-triphosphate,3'-diphosphate pyrophosphatase
MSETAAAIIPRWEWRAFDRNFVIAESRFGELENTGVQETEELYLLSDASGANVKVRFDLLDIKVLTEVDRHGLEQWIPVMKATFPLSPDELKKVFDVLETPIPDFGRSSFTLDEFLTELAVPAGIRPVTVTKRRVRYVVGGCTSEVSEVTVDGTPIRTIAIESEDAAAVSAAVRAMGLDGYTNTNYSQGLNDALDDADAVYGVLDVGTNSVKFHLASRSSAGQWTKLVDRASVTRLGEGLDATGDISAEALGRTASAISGMVEEALQHGARAIAAAGTAGLRIAGNSDSVVESIRERAGVTVEVVSGEEESRLAYIAVQAGLRLGEGPIVVFDTGGGSSQFTFGRGSHVGERFSVNVGAVSYTERFGLDGVVTDDVLTEALQAISDDLDSIDNRPVPDTLVAMGGAVTNITAVKHGLAVYDPDIVNGSILDHDEIDRQISMYASTPTEDRRSIVGLQPKRAEVILAGACIVKTVMEKLGKESATISDRGLRHGLLVERFGP